MAGIFDVGVGEGLNSSVTPTTPPAPVKEVALGMLAGAVGAGTEMYMKGLENRAKAEESARKNLVLSELNSKIEAISQAKSAGKIDSSKAAMRISVLNKSYIAANPSYTEDIQKFFGSKLGGGWSGGILKDETEAEKTRQKYLDKAAAVGVIPNNPTDSDLDFAAVIGKQALARDALNEAAAEELAIRAKKQSMQFGANAESRAQENQNRTRLERHYTDTLFNVLPYEMKANATKMQGIYDEWVKGGKTEEGKQKALMDIMLMKDSANTRMVEVGKFSPDTQKSLESVLPIFDNYAKMFTTKDESEYKKLKQDSDMQVLLAERAVTANLSPSERAIVYASKGFRYAVGLQNTASKSLMKGAASVTDEDLMRVYARNASPTKTLFNPFSGEPEDAAVIKAYPSLMLRSWESASKEGDPEVIGEYNIQLNSYLKSLKQHMGSIDRPSDLEPAIGILTDPAMGKWIRSGQADNDAVDSARMVYQTYYRDEVLKSASKILQGSVVSVGGVGQKNEVIDMSKDIEPILEGDRVILVKKGAKYQDSALRSNADVAKLTKIVNNFLNVSANLDGTSKDKVLETIIKPYVFGIEEAPKGNSQ